MQQIENGAPDFEPSEMEGFKMLIELFALATSFVATPPPPSEGKGFVCTLEGSRNRLEINVYLKAKIYHQRDFLPMRIYAVLDDTVVLENRDSSPDDHFAMLLDRRTLELTVMSKIPKQLPKSVVWHCEMGPVIDFDPPNQF